MYESYGTYANDGYVDNRDYDDDTDDDKAWRSETFFSKEGPSPCFQDPGGFQEVLS